MFPWLFNMYKDSVIKEMKMRTYGKAELLLDGGMWRVLTNLSTTNEKLQTIYSE